MKKLIKQPRLFRDILYWHIFLIVILLCVQQAWTPYSIKCQVGFSILAFLCPLNIAYYYLSDLAPACDGILCDILEALFFIIIPLNSVLFAFFFSWALPKRKMLATIAIVILSVAAVWAVHLDWSDARNGLCQGNLGLIKHAKAVYAIKNDKKEGDPVVDEAVYKFITGGRPECPCDGTYTLNEAGVYPSCSYHSPKLPSQPTETKAE